MLLLGMNLIENKISLRCDDGRCRDDGRLSLQSPSRVLVLTTHIAVTTDVAAATDVAVVERNPERNLSFLFRTDNVLSMFPS